MYSSEDNRTSFNVSTITVNATHFPKLRGKHISYRQFSELIVRTEHVLKHFCLVAFPSKSEFHLLALLFVFWALPDILRYNGALLGNVLYILLLPLIKAGKKLAFQKAFHLSSLAGLYQATNYLTRITQHDDMITQMMQLSNKCMRDFCKKKEVGFNSGCGIWQIYITEPHKNASTIFTTLQWKQLQSAEITFEKVDFNSFC